MALDSIIIKLTRLVQNEDDVHRQRQNIDDLLEIGTPKVRFSKSIGLEFIKYGEVVEVQYNKKDLKATYIVHIDTRKSLDKKDFGTLKRILKSLNKYDG